MVDFPKVVATPNSSKHQQSRKEACFFSVRYPHLSMLGSGGNTHREGGTNYRHSHPTQATYNCHIMQHSSIHTPLIKLRLILGETDVIQPPYREKTEWLGGTEHTLSFCLLTCSLIHSLSHSLIHSFIHSLMNSFINSCTCLLIHSFIH